MADPMALDEFAQRWQLDERATQTLSTLDAEVQARVMSGFAPKDISRGASAAFMGFVKGVTQGAGTGQYQQTAHQPAHVVRVVAGGCGGSNYGNPSLDMFVQEWGLDAGAQQTLYRLDPTTQQRVMSGFAPMDVSRGASAAFMGFVKSISMSTPRQTAVSHTAGFQTASGQVQTGDPVADAFITQWDLDAKAAEALVRLDPDMQARVMSGFAPKDISRGASIVLMGFIRSIAGSGGPASPMGAAPQSFSGGGCSGHVQSFQGGHSVGAWGAPAAQQQQAQAAWSGGGARKPNAGRHAASEAFATQWGLDDRAQHSLETLDAETQQKVMHEFQPPDVSRGASAAFMAFVKSVVGRQQQHQQQQPWVPQVVAPNFGNVPGQQPGYTGAQMVKDFIAGGHLPGGQWKNDENTVVLQNLPEGTGNLEVYKLASPFGAVQPGGVRVLPGKGSGFVNFQHNEAAALAVMTLNDAELPTGVMLRARPYTSK